MCSDTLISPDTVPAAAHPASRSSFYVAMRVLPAAQRAAMFGIYAFCRAVDDIADSDAPARERRAGLERWRRAVDACYDGQDLARLPDLRRHIEAFGLARADFHSVIDGMMMDAGTSALCAPDAATLDLYCDRVASSVGRLSVRVFGMERDDGLALAHHLGRALQLTNILRDIDDDAENGRMYLPREALQDAGVELGSTASIAAHPALPRACDGVAAQAHAHFDQAEAIARRSRARAVRAPRIMSAAYQALLARLAARGWNYPRQPVTVPTLQRAAILLRHAFL
ncbi:presqualene diphosphate synthase HpnD [Massilia horti]|uniref:Presqualene diphosphate synthase HpnD n=1 Tax=Massilia horti TaxID=2562153 RepID=A0A4Y9SXM7_9BURK|nr:presqualene diphosphate synthase HpnD [Massilia horti]TFW31601.1 presqualene diphosphate synthase HpnD [Massilia horti]TFW31606.1 presqualene diphosphate synthase HpnD [Massilia horti]